MRPLGFAWKSSPPRLIFMKEVRNVLRALASFPIAPLIQNIQAKRPGAHLARSAYWTDEVSPRTHSHTIVWGE